MLWRSLCYDDARLYYQLYAFSDGSIACIVNDTIVVDGFFFYYFWSRRQTGLVYIVLCIGYSHHEPLDQRWYRFLVFDKNYILYMLHTIQVHGVR